MKIICIGQNYREHIKELGTKVPEKPVFFCKPDTALLLRNRPFYIPDFTRNLHYETELVVRICKVGKNIAPRFAPDYYDAYTLGFDFTARDIQEYCRREGLPWEACKAFDNSAAIGTFVPLKETDDIQHLSFHLDINGQTVQQGCTDDMLFSVDKIIAYVSRFFTLKIGDLIYTGTPAGIGAVHIGDHLEGYLGDQKLLDFHVR